MRRLSPSVLLLALVFLASGCGTLIHGTTQEVTVLSQPTGAEVVVGGRVVGVTPATVKLNRGQSHLVTVRLDGYTPERVLIRKKTDYVVVALDALTTYGIGLVVDLANGAAYSLDPSDTFVLLRERDSTATEPPPFPSDELLSIGPRRQNGPRFGLTFLAPGIVDRINASQGEDRFETPFTTQFGWQLEFPTFQTEQGLTGVVEVVPLVGGLERSVILPTVSLIAGARTPTGIELGVGPTLTLTGVGTSDTIEVVGASLALVGGQSFDLGGAHVPVNGALVLGEGGIRASILVGLTTSRGRY